MQHRDLAMRIIVGVVLSQGAATVPALAAEAVKIGPAQTSRLPKGKEADAIAGDYLLRSDTVAATIGGEAAFRDANVNTQAVQGAVLDLVRLDHPEGDNDLLDAFYPQGHYLDAPGPTRVEVLQADGPEVAIRFTREGRSGMQGDIVDVATEYHLRDGERFLRIKTTYRNRGEKPAHAAVYDKIRADTLFRIPPAGVSKSLIYDEPWHGASYGVVRAAGAPIESYATPARVTYNHEGGNRLDFPDLVDAAQAPLDKALPKPVTIAPGGSLTVERFLVPGRHPADVRAVVAAILNERVTPRRLRVTDPSGRPAAGALVRAVRGEAVLSEGRTDREGRVTLIVDDAEPCAVAITQRGREAKNAALGAPSPDETALTVGPIAEAAFDVVAGAAGVREHGPVKVMIVGVAGTPDPNFGPDALPLQAGNLCFSRDGRFTVALPAGQYEALIGRGPEFSVERRRFAVAHGETTQIAAEIRREFRTEGWVIADFHNHTTASNDSIAETGGRVVGLAAGGLEFAPATEHNRISSFQSWIDRLELGAYLRSTGGIELSGRPGPGALNHQNAFPLKIHDDLQGGGAPRTDRDPKVQMGRLFHYDDDAEKFVQQNHPDFGSLYYDRDRDGTPDGGFGTRPITHGVEVNRGIVSLLRDLETAGSSAPAVKAKAKAKAKTKGGGNRPGPAFFWLQMLNQGDRIYATANSDAHTTSHNNGVLFTYLASATDDPAKLDPLELARAAKAGRMVLSNGPFLEVSIDGVGPGGDVRGDRPLNLKVRAVCAERMDIDRVQVLINGRPDPSLNFTRRQNSEGFSAGPERLRFARTIPLHVNGDAHVIVVAVGEGSHLGPFWGPHASEAPTAMSNPIFVDTDGNGFQPNRDTLGAPLPTGSRGGGGGGESE